MQLDEDDHQHVRYCFLTCLLTTGWFREAERHIKTYESPEECLWLYAGALAAFGRHGDNKKSQKALDRALMQNPFAAARILKGDTPPAPEPEIDDDADICARELIEAWSMTPGAFDWLAQRLDHLESQD